ncbi:MAG: hypothetical protein UU61_C0021G0009, partial [Parcubacteria group bacterium GW2011_GWB1_41_4]
NRFFAIFLEDNSFLNNRINLTAKFFGKYLGIDSVIFKISKKNAIRDFLSQFALIYALSFKLAEINKIDPFENLIQERLKKELKKR